MAESEVSDGPGPIRGFFGEVRRRRVITTLLWYVGGAITLIEGADALLGPLSLPAGTPRIFAVVALAALPVVLVLAWFYDVRSEPEDVGVLSRSGRVTAVAGTGLLSIASVAILLAYGRGRPADPPVGLPPERVAVLPFEAPGGDARLDAFAASLHGRVIDGLHEAGARVVGGRGLRVISRAGVLPYGGGGATIDSIGRALGVGTIIEGMLVGTEGRLQARLRLLDATTAEQLRTTVAEVGEGEHLALLDAVADSLVSLVRVELGEVIADRMRLSGTESREAFDLVVRAERHTVRFERALEARELERAAGLLDRADALLAEAERLDPRWVEPALQRGHLADLRAQLAFGRGEAELGRVYREALDHVRRALTLAPRNPRALALRGWLRLRHSEVAADLDPAEIRRLREGAERDLRAALEDNARPAEALRSLSELLAAEGRIEEALATGERAYEEDPYLEGVEPSVYRLFEYSFQLGRDAEAARWCESGGRRFDHHLFEDCRLQLMAWSERETPRPDTAWALLRAELSEYPAPLRAALEPRLHGLVAAVLARAGMADSARAVLGRARAADRGTPGFLRTAAGVHLLLEEPDSARIVLGRLLTAPNTRESLLRAPELRGAYRVPELRDLLASIEGVR